MLQEGAALAGVAFTAVNAAGTTILVALAILGYSDWKKRESSLKKAGLVDDVIHHADQALEVVSRATNPMFPFLQSRILEMFPGSREEDFDLLGVIMVTRSNKGDIDAIKRLQRSVSRRLGYKAQIKLLSLVSTWMLIEDRAIEALEMRRRLRSDHQTSSGQEDLRVQEEKLTQYVRSISSGAYEDFKRAVDDLVDAIQSDAI